MPGARRVLLGTEARGLQAFKPAEGGRDEAMSSNQSCSYCKCDSFCQIGSAKKIEPVDGPKLILGQQSFGP